MQQSLLPKYSGWADTENTVIGAIQLHHQHFFFYFLVLRSLTLKKDISNYFLSCSIFCRNICLGDVSHNLLLTVAFSTIKWKTSNVGNYIFFHASKLPRLGGDSEEKETLEWIAKCQIVHNFTISVSLLGKHKHITWK